MHQVGNLAQHLPLEGAFGQRAPERPRIARQVRPTLGTGQVATFACNLEEESAQWRRFIDETRKRLGAVLANETVRVVLGWQEKELDAAHVGGIRQGAIERLARGTPTGGVAVEAEHHGIGEAEQLLHMLRRAGRAQRGHRIRKTQLRQRHHVHIALGNQCIATLA